MKAKKIVSACKESKRVHAITTTGGRQFIETKHGYYLIDGMPRMEAEEFLAYLDVPRSDREKWDVIETNTIDRLFSDMNEDDITLAPHPISVVCGGRHLQAFVTDDGAVLWIDTEAFAPMAAAEWRFTLRGSDIGEPYIAVTEGLYLMAVLHYELSPNVMPGRTLDDRLRELISERTEPVDKAIGEADGGEDIVGELKRLYEGEES